MWPLPLAIIALASVACVMVGFAYRHPEPNRSFASLLLTALGQWDGGWYARIATDGYFYKGAVEQSPVAFFPAYPLAIRALGWVGVPTAWAATALSFTFGLAGLTMFSVWARRLVPAMPGALVQPHQQATLLFAAYPFATYLYGINYGDGLFLLAITSAFICVETERPWLAALSGIVATAARPMAPAVVVGLTVRSWERYRQLSADAPLRQRPWVIQAVSVLAPGLAGLGLLAYMVFLQLRFGDAFAFVHVQGAPGWDQTPGAQTWMKAVWLEQLRTNTAPLITVRLLAHPFFTFVALALVPRLKRTLGLGYAVYVALAVGLPAFSTKDFQGMGRYLIAAFPVFVAASTLMPLRSRWSPVLIGASLLAMLGAAVLFGSGFYLS